MTEAGGVSNATPGTPTATGTLTSTDVDGTNNLFTATSAGTESTGGYGTYVMTSAGVWTYTLDNNNATVQALAAAATLTDTFTVTTADGTAQVVTINITGSNDAPTLSATTTTVNYANTANAQTLFTAATASAVDTGQTITGLTFTVSGLDGTSNEKITVDGTEFSLTNATSGSTTANNVGYSVAVTGSNATVTLTHAGLSATQSKTLVEGLAYRYAAAGGMTGNHVITLTQVTDSGSDNNVTTLNLASTLNDTTAPSAQFDLVQSVLNNNAGLTYNFSTGSFYRLDSVEKFWEAANTTAANSKLFGFDGHLVHVNSAIEQTAIVNALMGSWIGGSDTGTEGTWQWYYGANAGATFSINATAEAGAYVSWPSGEPNNIGFEGEDYAETTALWNDIGNQTRPYSIEWEGSKVLNTQTYANTSAIAVKSTEAGTAYLVNAAHTVNSVADINALMNGALWNSKTLISTPNTVLSSEDFAAGTPTGWGNTSATDLGGALGRILGSFGRTDEVSKTYNFGAVLAGQTVNIDFDMIEMDTWDGELFKVSINGEESSVQSYFTGALGINDGGIDLGNRGYVHHYTVQATLDSNGQVTLGFGAALNEEIDNESWGIDNVVITKVSNSTLLELTGLADGTYKLYTADSEGNLSAAAANTITVDTPPTVIDLGSSGKLIAPVQVEGKWYYYWDLSGDGTSGNTGTLNGGLDYVNHDTLDGIFKYDINGTLNPNAGTDTTETYRYATINGVQVALPTYGAGVDGSGKATPIGVNKAGTAVSNNTTDNPTYNDLLAIWDAYNGSGTSTGDRGVPAGWQAGGYWSATPSASGHALVGLNNGFVNGIADGNNLYVALQVL